MAFNLWPLGRSVECAFRLGYSRNTQGLRICIDCFGAFGQFSGVKTKAKRFMGGFVGGLLSLPRTHKQNEYKAVTK